MFAACNGTGQAPWDEVPHGRLQPRVVLRRRPPKSAVRRTCRTPNRSRTSTWRTSGCSPTGCSSRSSTRASSRTSTSSPRKRSRASIFPTARGAATAGRATSSPRSPNDRDAMGRTQGRASTTQRSATSSTRHTSPGASTRAGTAATSSGNGAIWSGYQAVKHIYRGPDWRRTSSTPQLEVHHRRARRQARELYLDHAGLRRFRSYECGGGYGPSWVAALVNAVGKSKFWNSTAIFVQWDDWGGLYDHVPPPFRGLRRRGLPRSHCS